MDPAVDLARRTPHTPRPARRTSCSRSAGSPWSGPGRPSRSAPWPPTRPWTRGRTGHRCATVQAVVPTGGDDHRVPDRDPGDVLDGHGLLVVGQRIGRCATDPAQRRVQAGQQACRACGPRSGSRPGTATTPATRRTATSAAAGRRVRTRSARHPSRTATTDPAR